MKPRVTQGDVARAAGVHNTTVSLSLRNCPSIPAATRKRIQAVAQQLGYFPDPALRALVAYRNGRAPQVHRSTLAFLTGDDARGAWKVRDGLVRAFAGAQRRAAELGYQLEHFWIGEPGMSPRRLSDVLFHRGISGTLVAPTSGDGERWHDFDWSRLSIVALGDGAELPALHRVTDDHGGMVRLAVRRLHQLGCTRIGLVLVAPGGDENVEHSWFTGFLAGQAAFPSSDHVPVLRLAPPGGKGHPGTAKQLSPTGRDALGRWFAREQPDAVISVGRAVLESLRGLGLAVPRDAAYVDLAAESDGSGVAGVRPNSETVGEVAIALLDAQIQQHTVGRPRVATSTLIEGSWIDGETVPVARAAGAWNEAERAVAV